MKFTKMQAFGNDYVYIDAIHQHLDNLPARPKKGISGCGCLTRMEQRARCVEMHCAA